MLFVGLLLWLNRYGFVSIECCCYFGVRVGFAVACLLCRCLLGLMFLLVYLFGFGWYLVYLFGGCWMFVLGLELVCWVFDFGCGWVYYADVWVCLCLVGSWGVLFGLRLDYLMFRYTVVFVIITLAIYVIACL